jgi:hypothetical protein
MYIIVLEWTLYLPFITKPMQINVEKHMYINLSWYFKQLIALVLYTSIHIHIYSH